MESYTTLTLWCAFGLFMLSKKREQNLLELDTMNFSDFITSLIQFVVQEGFIPLSITFFIVLLMNNFINLKILEILKFLKFICSKEVTVYIFLMVEKRFYTVSNAICCR